MKGVGAHIKKKKHWKKKSISLQMDRWKPVGVEIQDAGNIIGGGLGVHLSFAVWKLAWGLSAPREIIVGYDLLCTSELLLQAEAIL